MENKQMHPFRESSLRALTAQLMAYNIDGDFCVIGDDNLYPGQVVARAMMDVGRISPVRMFFGQVENLLDVAGTVNPGGFPPKMLHWHNSEIPKAIKKYKPQLGIAMIWLSLEDYEPTKAVLHDLFPALNKGGVLIVDKNGWPGCYQAVDEYLVGPYKVLPKVKINDTCLHVWMV